ncbi:MAG: class I SAM-dependent methyltransferase [Chloroflexi bacterium]|nr:class I SAM-dependent methyltransferase [Chloroflexota bacterium]
MPRERIERDFASYFYQYFRYYFNSPVRLKQYYQFCKHVFDTTQAKNKNVLDVGCGFGLISVHLASFGAKTVSAIDANEEKIAVFQKILSRLSPTPDNIKVKLGDALDLEYEDNCFDVVVVNEVLSHVREPDSLIHGIHRVLQPGGILYLKDGNNDLDIAGKYRRQRFWSRREYGPVDESSIRGTEKPIPWLQVRREIIRGNYPHLDTKTLNLLAKDTAGMYGNEIDNAVKDYLQEGSIVDKPAFKYRDPVTGEYNEAEFSPYQLKKELENNGFSAVVIRPFFPIRPLLSAKDILANIAICGIRMGHPISMIVSPHFEILAQKQ